MKRLGKVLHLSKSGNLIVRLELPEPPKIGLEVCNSRLEKVGTIGSILGPVKAPYLSIQPSPAHAVSLQGRVLYQVSKE